MANGFAKLTASTQYFLDTCDAVANWTAIGDDYCEFEYDDTIEVSLVPPGVYFDDADDQRERAALRSVRTACVRAALSDDDTDAVLDYAYNNADWSDCLRDPEGVIDAYREAQE